MENTGLVFKMYTDLSNYQKGLKQAGNDLNQFQNNLNKIGGLAAGVFSTAALINYGKEAVALAAKAESIEKAFNRIGGDSFMPKLKEATRGTISELELMKQAVRAENFDIPLDNLATLFEFARRRAEETGQSVDYLVESIVLGIGRKSPLILDNLGISAVSLRQKLKGVSAETASVGDIAKVVGDIAREELAQMGNEAETSQQKMLALAAEWDNMKLAIGKAILESESFKIALDAIKGIIENWTNGDVINNAKGLLFAPPDLTNIDNVNKRLKEVESTMTSLGLMDDTWLDKVFHFGRANEARELNNDLYTLFTTLKNAQKELAKVTKTTDDDKKKVGLYEDINSQIKTYKDLIETTNSEEVIAKSRREIALLEKKKERLDALGKSALGIYGELNEKLKTYRERLESANSEEAIRGLRQKISLLEMEKQRYDLIGESMKKMISLSALGAKKKNSWADTGTNMPIDITATKKQDIISGSKMTIAGKKNNYTAADIKNESNGEQLAKLKEEANQAAEILNQFRTDTLTASSEAFGLMLAGDMGLTDFFDMLISSILDFAKQFGKLLISLGLAKISLEKLGVSGIGAVIAGGALIAMTSMIQGMMSRGPSMPALATGTNYIPQDGPYYLHEGEAVVPKKYNSNQSMMPARVHVSGRISGKDILISSGRQQHYNSRITGS